MTQTSPLSSEATEMPLKEEVVALRAEVETSFSYTVWNILDIVIERSSILSRTIDRHTELLSTH